MRKTLAVVAIGTTLLSTSCGKKESGTTVDLSSFESVSMRTNSASQDDPPPDEEGGAGTAMALDEGQMGKMDKAEGHYKLRAGGSDPQLARQQALESARVAGLLGSTGLRGSKYVSSGFDDRNIYGGLAGPAAGDDTTTDESYQDHGKNAWVDAAKDRLSTFAADVDTASYTIARRKLESGTLPPRASVRVEELVNYFHYTLPAPAGPTPFGVVIDAAPSPLAPGKHLLRVAVSTKAKAIRDRKPAHLVFLVDVSGSMASPDKLDLAKQSLRILTQNLTDNDTVALVTYAGSTRVVLPATGVGHRAAILAAIDTLESGGSTGMDSGIDLAYREAMKGLVPGAVARVIVCSDGDANVGATTHGEILKLIAGRAKEGVTLSTIGFGMGNYKDELMEQLADKGNGNNFYIDSLAAAKRVFQDQLGSTLEVVAKDVKLQVDFDPAMVARYRLIGYENRDVADRDFRNDKVDAGEIGAGHQVTAVYEVELTGAGKQLGAPIAAVRIRHKEPRGDQATEAAFPMVGGPAATFGAASSELRFAVAVAAFADVLRGGDDAKTWSLAQIRDLAQQAAGTDPDRKELVGLVEQAMRISGRTSIR